MLRQHRHQSPNVPSSDCVIVHPGQGIPSCWFLLLGRHTKRSLKLLVASLTTTDGVALLYSQGYPLQRHPAKE